MRTEAGAGHGALLSRARCATRARRASGCRLLPMVLVCLLAAGCGGQDKHASAAKPRPSRTFSFSPGTGKMIDVGGGRSVRLLCVGSGTPTVVLDAFVIEDASAIQGELGRTTRTCAYDSPGSGYSSDLPPGDGGEVQDLDRLVHAAHLPAPYVLVGFGSETPIVSAFAKAHAAQTAGVVLTNAVGAHWRPRFLALGQGRPAGVQRRLRRDVGPPFSQGIDWNALGDQAAGVGTLGRTPLVVVSTKTPPFDLRNLPASVRRAAAQLHMTQQDELAALSSDRQHIVATRSGANVLATQPDVVARGVREVVRAARSGARLAACPQVFRGPGVSCRD